MNNKKIIVNDRFLNETLRSTGYSPYAAIFELIDNSIDAKASSISIEYDSKFKTLVIKDNGIGMSSKTLENAMTLGCNQIYDGGRIGNFGVGLKSACLNLIEENEVEAEIRIISNHNGNSSIVIWEPNKTVTDYNLIHGSASNIKGTTIIIKNVVKFQPATLIRKISVTYFKMMLNGTSIFFNKEQIKYFDPLYRNSDLTQTNRILASICGINIQILGCYLSNDEIKGGFDLQDRYSMKASGIYILYGDRYIQTGGTCGLLAQHNHHNNIRIEFLIPKELTSIFRVKFNKLGGFDFSENDNLNDLNAKIRQMFSWGLKLYFKKQSEPQIIEQNNELKPIEKSINESLKTTGITRISPPTPIFTEVKLKENNTEESPLYRIISENMGVTNKMYDLSFQDSKFTITLNIAHPFYNVYLTLNGDGRKSIIKILAAEAFARYKMTSQCDFANECFWDDYDSEISTILKRLT